MFQLFCKGRIHLVSKNQSIRKLSSNLMLELDQMGKTKLISTAQNSLQVLKESRDNYILKRIKEIEEEINKNPEIWETNARSAKKLSKEQRDLKDRLLLVNDLESNLSSLLELSELAEKENDTLAGNEFMIELNSVAEKARKVELELLLSGPADHMGCYIEVNSGSGGTEAMDFAGMLFRMYEMWGNETGFDVEIKEKQDGPEAGIRSATLAVNTPFAYGWLRGEQGTHRICRVSPYDAAQRRHTSFAQVAIFPMDSSDSEIEIDIKESDLKYEAFRSSGPGGQSVNTTSSAVRVTHVPTGMTATCQEDRSQHVNKKNALNMLRSKMLAKELKARQEEQAKVRSQLGEASFGTQVRSYYWNPKRFVKDHRSNYEEHDAEGVLNGSKLQPFMEAYLQWEATNRKT